MFESAADRLDALQAVGGEQFVYFDGETTVEIYGVFRAAHQKVESNRGPAVGSRRPEIEIALDEIAEPRQGDLLFRGPLTAFTGDFDYEVATARPDESERMATLTLKAVGE